MSDVWNSFTVDVEDWFQVSAFRSHIQREDWSDCELRVERNMGCLLKTMADAGVRATCFVLGWVADRVPSLVRSISDAGHEIATHGYAHELVCEQRPSEFRECIHRSVETLRGISGQPVWGHRAASFSMPRTDWEWVYEALAAEGIRYDSSIFPGRRGDGGHPDGRRTPYDVRTTSGTVREFPMAAATIGGVSVPFGGGGYFRLYPYWLTRQLIDRANRRGWPVVFYVHPWELDSDQPRQSVGAVTRFRHYNNIGRVKGRLQRLLSDFTFVPLGERIEDA